MHRTLRLPLLAALALLSGCVVHTYRPAPRPPPPPAPRAMGYQEAVDRAYRVCAERGYSCELEKAHATDGNTRWKVKLAAATRSAAGRLELEFDAFTRDLVRSKEKLKPYGKHKKHGHDDDAFARDDD